MYVFVGQPSDVQRCAESVCQLVPSSDPVLLLYAVEYAHCVGVWRVLSFPSPLRVYQTWCFPFRLLRRAHYIHPLPPKKRKQQHKHTLSLTSAHVFRFSSDRT